MRRAATMALAVVLVTGVAACSRGPSEEERIEFDQFAIERQSGYPSAMSPTVPTSIQEYILGGEGVTAAAYVVAGSFTGGRALPAPEGTADPSAVTVIGEFRLHKSLRGEVPSTFDVNLGTSAGDFDVDAALRGAGDVVLFLSYESASSGWVLVDGKYALAQSDEGGLSMPFVPGPMGAQYLTGVLDVADVEALIIAGDVAPEGGLDDIGSDPNDYQDLIDQANDLVD